VVEVVALQTYALKVFVMAFLAALAADRQVAVVLEALVLEAKVLLVEAFQSMQVGRQAAAVHPLLEEVVAQPGKALQGALERRRQLLVHL
jgi:hypothetical protein